jgi:carbamoyl-phosphate synthase small subunit
VCFNTGTTGYQEVFTDPSYFGQILVTTNVHIGNYGVYSSDNESSSIKISGLVCRNFSSTYSRELADGSLDEFFNSNNVLVVSDIDTRALVSYIRDNGAMNAVISTEVDKIEELKAELSSYPSMQGLELASKVTTKEPYFYGDENSDLKIAALDLGIKENILRNLSKRGAYIKVFPYDSTFTQLEDWNPHGYFISNGPGDPEPLKQAQEVAKEIISKNLPLFGICLGHQVISLANGISTYKMHNGHRGINHPVKNLLSGKGEITSQNHGFVVEEKSVPKSVIITHKSLFDGSVEGIRHKSKSDLCVIITDLGTDFSSTTNP